MLKPDIMPENMPPFFWAGAAVVAEAACCSAPAGLAFDFHGSPNPFMMFKFSLSDYFILLTIEIKL